jgi:hypothetical protein
MAVPSNSETTPNRAVQAHFRGPPGFRTLDLEATMTELNSPGRRVHCVTAVRALGLAWPDFEDAVCAAAAEASGCDAFVTRDPDGYPNAPLPVIDPAAALGWLTQEQGDAAPLASGH